MLKLRPSHRAASLTAHEPLLQLEENRFALQAAAALHAQPVIGSTRLAYIYGSSGVGKTLLSRQLLRERLKENSETNFDFLTAAEFAANFAEASQNATIADFQSQHRAAELLICEDLQSIAGRYETQWQLLWLIDEIAANNGSILLTAQCSPGNLDRFLPRLISRFHGGICASIALPEFDSRLQLVRQFAQLEQIPLTEPAAELIAKLVTASPRELRANLRQLEAAAQAAKHQLDVDFIQQYMQRETHSPPLTLAQVARSVAKEFDTTLAEMRSEKRSRGIVLARQSAMHLARELTQHSYSSIAVYFHRKNHTTVVHACDRIKHLLTEDPAIRCQLANISKELGGPTTI